MCVDGALIWRGVRISVRAEWALARADSAIFRQLTKLEGLTVHIPSVTKIGEAAR
jgi:hypothetical protein